MGQGVYFGFPVVVDFAAPTVAGLTNSGNMATTGNESTGGTHTWTDTGTATASSGAATLSKTSGIVTTESLTTAQNADYTLTLTNTLIAATSMVLVTVENGDNSQGTPVLRTVTPGSGSVVIVVRNAHATSQAFNGTLKIRFVVIKTA